MLSCWLPLNTRRRRGWRIGLAELVRIVATPIAILAPTAVDPAAPLLLLPITSQAAAAVTIFAPAGYCDKVVAPIEENATLDHVVLALHQKARESWIQARGCLLQGKTGRRHSQALPRSFCQLHRQHGVHDCIPSTAPCPDRGPLRSPPAGAANPRWMSRSTWWMPSRYTRKRVGAAEGGEGQIETRSAGSG